MAINNTNKQEIFRQTGKFKPIQDQIHSQRQLESSCQFKVVSLQSIGLDFTVASQKKEKQETKWWRLYFQENPNTIKRQLLVKTIQNLFDRLVKSEQLQQNISENVFVNVSNILVEKIKLAQSPYVTSNMDYQCVIVIQSQRQNLQGKKLYHLECYQVAVEIPIEIFIQGKQFRQEIYLHIKGELDKFYVLSKNKTLFIVKDLEKQLPILELSDQNLQQSFVDIQQRILIIKNLSPRIISIKFMEQNFSKNTEPLQVVITNSELFQTILFKINRIKYGKYKIDEVQGKEWHSFDKTQVDSKKESKTTPQKSKNNRPQMPSTILYKASNKSTDNLQKINQHQSKKGNKVAMMNNQRNMKISQRVVANPKQSNLVPSQLDYPVSVKDQKEKQSGYFDEFQNLLYQQQVQQKQLALNDSFQEFQKKQNSVKDLEIISQLNKKKAKVNEQLKMLDSLKQKIQQLANEEKEWINKNFKLKIQIKKLKTNEGKSQSNKQLDDIKQKIKELKIYQKALIQELNQIRSHNNIQILTFDAKKTPQSSQRTPKDNKIFQSYNPFNSNSLTTLQLTTSIRSNNSPNAPKKIYQPFATDSKPNNFNLQHNFRQVQTKHNTQIPSLVYHPTFPPSSGLSLYSSIQAKQGFIQNNNLNTNSISTNFNPISNLQGLQSNQSGNEYCEPQNKNTSNQVYVSILNFANKASPQSSIKKVYPQYNSNIKKL